MKNPCVNKEKRMQEHYPSLWLQYLTDQCTAQEKLNFETEILPKTVYVMIGFIIAQVVDNFASQPIIFSKTTKSHPLEIFLIIIIGGILAGPLGMIIAVPTYTVLKVILKEFMSDNKIVSSLNFSIPNLSKSGENFLTVKYEKIVPLLIEAIKELNNKIEKLETQLASK